MDATVWLGVEICMQTQVLTGFIYQPYEERLLDLLSGVSIRRTGSRGRFLELSDVVIHYTDGKEERLASAYINKATIHIVTTSDSNSGRGIGAKAGPSPIHSWRNHQCR